DQGRITPEEAESARSRPIRVASARTRTGRTAPRAAYYVEHIRALLEDKLGEDLYSRPLRIHTALDLRVQEVAEAELEKQIRRVENGAFGTFRGPTRAQFEPGSAQTEYLQGAIVVMDQETGDVLALVGGRSETESSFDRAIDGKRQAGSAFKPFVYATALSRGWSPSDILDDSPYRLVSGGRTWEPRNADGDFLGPVTVRDALVHSRNVPTIRLAESVGVGNIEHLAKAAGLDADLGGTPVEALGVEDVSPLELTAAYTAFAAEGVAVRPRFILSVEAPDGRVLWQPDVERNRVMTPATAFIMTDLLRDVVNRGTGRHVRYAGYRGIAAGKTGTTNDGADTWFVGYTPRLTAGVWVGFDKPRPIASRASGGPIAAQVWGRLMNRIPDLAGRDEWRRPQQVIALSVDPESGLALADGCEPRNGEARTELFVKGREPETVCPDARPGPSWVDRIASRLGEWWSGFLGDRPVQVASSDEDRDRRGSVDGSDGDWNRRAPAGVRGDWPTGDWTGGLRDALEESMRQRAADRERVLEWLEDLSDAVDDIDLRDRDARRIQSWIDGIMRSVEQADRAARRQNSADVQGWMDDMIDRIGGQNLAPDQRRQLRRELMRAAEGMNILQ
ncbi:MAG: penicillin-binding transpeptidase domain-containing protein, partial [Gemmatimonadota bacterium]